MRATSYIARRGELETYFDRTAAAAWARLTSDAPLGRIRASVRAGREAMRAVLLAALPADMSGQRVLDAGCGTGALAVEAARRGADVLAVDLSATLTDLARERLPNDLGGGRVTFAVGDFLDPAWGAFDHVVAMDSLIHYQPADVVRALTGLAPRIARTLAFTFAPSTPLLAAMHAVGRLFPRGDRAPAIVPVREQALRQAMAGAPELAALSVVRSERVSSGFYTSQALLLRR
jgi:magnesium-protoporphyrin O-methyltransferase